MKFDDCIEADDIDVDVMMSGQENIPEDIL